ncbi:MAG: hypothetical protein JRJ87_19730 [Deltaproteobacteria bacterium]|nr:hypothetical protein [Deltaproteobacteria bacterium]
MIRLMLVLIVALTVLSCGSSGGSNLCDGVVCSDHGTCKVENDQAICECETGFVADGLECIPETTVESFTDGADLDTCTYNIPICQTVVGCVLGEKKFFEGQFPGFISFLITTPADATIVVKMFFETRMHPGQDTAINWYEPGCHDSYSYRSMGANIFEMAGEDRVFTQEQKIRREGDHLVEIYSDANAHYYLRTELR